MPPRRKAASAVAAPVLQQVAMPPPWMIQEAARAAKKATVEELARVQNSPGRCKSPVSAKANAPPGAVCSCGQRILPNSQFCTACGQSVQKRGAVQDPANVPNQKRQKKNTKLTAWRCEYKHGVDIRAGPDINESRVPHALEPGEEFMVEHEETGDDGVLYLKLADGRGWVFDQKPNWGVICAPCKARKASPKPVATPKKEKAKPNQRKAKAKEKAAGPERSDRSERSRSQKKTETAKQRRSSSSQRRSSAQDEKEATTPAPCHGAAKTSGPGSARRSSRAAEDFTTPAAPEPENRGRSCTPRPVRSGLVRNDAAHRGNQKSQEGKRRRGAKDDDELKGKATPQKSTTKSAPTTPVTSTTVMSPMMSMLRSCSSPVPKIDVPRTSPRRRPGEESPRPLGLVAAATAASRGFSEVWDREAPAVDPPKVERALATPPKEASTRRRARSMAPEDSSRALPAPASLIPAHVRAMLAKPVQRSRSAEPVPVPPWSKDPVVEISSEESVKEEDPVFEYELRQFRQRQEMERSAKSAWQQAQRLAEEAEKQRSETMEKTTVAEKRTLEVENALKQLRQAVAQVEQRSAERAAKLQQQREAAEAKVRQNEADLKEDSRKVELVHEEGAKKLELLEEQLAQKLRSNELPLKQSKEAFKDFIAKSRSKIQGKVLQLEKKAAAERKAVEAEAVAQRAVAPQLAALKSEVLATERGATEAEEARKRSEQRASSEEARLDAFLKRLPQLEVEASEKGEDLIQEAQEKASRDLAEAKLELRRCVEDASRRMQAARQSVERARTRTTQQIERQLDDAHRADAQVLEAVDQEKTSKERAEKVVAAAERDAPGVNALTKRFQVEQQRCHVMKRRQVMEKQLAQDLKELKEDHAQKVLSAARASESAALRSQHAVEAAKVALERHQKEMKQKIAEADANVTQMDQKAQATGLWSQEVRSKFNRLVQKAEEKLLEQQEMTQQEERLEEERAKERLEATGRLLRETEILASVAEEDAAARTVLARSEAREAAQQAAERQDVAREAEEAARQAALMEMDATQRELEETCTMLRLQTDEMKETCLQQQQEASDGVDEARSAVAQAIALARSRLAAIQSCAAAAAKDVLRAQQEEQLVAEKLEEREIDFITAVEDLEKAELNKNCTSSHCQDLLMAAEQSAVQRLKQAQQKAEGKKNDEEDRAQRVEELAETLEGQALSAEELLSQEQRKQEHAVQREERRICQAVQEASNRAVNVQDAIREAIHYSQKNLDELYRYLEKMGLQHSPPETPSPNLSHKGLGKGCPKCNVTYTPTSSYCQQCGVKLVPPSSQGPVPGLRKICSRSYGRLRRSSPAAWGTSLPGRAA